MCSSVNKLESSHIPAERQAHSCESEGGKGGGDLRQFVGRNAKNSPSTIGTERIGSRSANDHQWKCLASFAWRLGLLEAQLQQTVVFPVVDAQNAAVFNNLHHNSIHDPGMWTPKSAS